jgi:dTDP-4-amino-4,6-dideoxygalactose transaminase
VRKEDRAMTGPKTRRSIPIAAPSTGVEEWEALRAPLESGWLTQGPRVAEFERAFAARHQVPFALATTSGTTALHLALAALGVGPGDEVIVPAFTWVATANAVVYCGASPAFADIDPVTFNVTAEEIGRRLTPRTKAVIVVHLFGLCADMDSIREVVPPHVPLIEDAACAAGAAWRGRPAGSMGALAAFSFHPRKSITTGEGGMLTTADRSLHDKAASLRNHGAALAEGPTAPYLLPEFNLLGFNYRMTDLQGALGIVQLGKLDGFIAERDRWADYYRRELRDLAWLKLPDVPKGATHSWQAYVTRLDEALAPHPRNAIMERLAERGIATRPGTHAVPLLGYYREYRKRLGCRAEDFPTAEASERFSMALPLHNRMTPDDYAYVCEALHDLA